MNNRRTAPTRWKWLTLWFTLAAFALSACQPLPAPAPDTREEGLGNGATAGFANVNLHWTPAEPADVSRDRYEIEFMSGAGQVLLSHVIENDREIIQGGRPLTVWLTSEGESQVVLGRLQLRVECSQTYYWRVRQLQATRLSPWSETWAFTIAAPPTAAPTQRWPVEGERITGGRFAWDPLPGALPEVMYEYEISDQPNASGSVDVRREPHSLELVLGGEPLPGVTLLHGQRYYWRVRALYVPDCAGPWSPMRSFIWDSASVYAAILPTPVGVCPITGCVTPSPGPSPSRTPRPTWTPFGVSPLGTQFVPVARFPTATPLSITAPAVTLPAPIVRTPTPTRAPAATSTPTLVPPTNSPAPPPPSTDTPLPPNDTDTPVPAPVDFDGDKWDETADCNDKDPSINPDAPETPKDGIDSNCNGDDDT